MTAFVPRPTRHVWLPHWLREAGYDICAEKPKALRACVLALGVNSRTWKLYAEYGDDLLRPLGERWLGIDRVAESLRNAVDYLRLLSACEVDIAPPPNLVAALAKCIPAGQTIAALPVAVFRGAWRAYTQRAYAGVRSDQFIEHEFVPILRWLFTERGMQRLDSNQLKAGWAWLRATCLAQQRRRSLPSTEVHWTTPLQRTAIANLLFVPLQSEQALQDEGEVMQHCVGHLADCCRKGCLRVFSVRDAKTMDRVATFAVRAEGAEWVFGSLKGESNTTPAATIRRVATTMLSRLKAQSKPALPNHTQCAVCVV